MLYSGFVTKANAALSETASRAYQISAAFLFRFVDKHDHPRGRRRLHQRFGVVIP